MCVKELKTALNKPHYFICHIFVPFRMVQSGKGRNKFLKKANTITKWTENVYRCFVSQKCFSKCGAADGARDQHCHCCWSCCCSWSPKRIRWFVPRIQTFMVILKLYYVTSMDNNIYIDSTRTQKNKCTLNWKTVLHERTQCTWDQPEQTTQRYCGLHTKTALTGKCCQWSITRNKMLLP